MDFNLDFQDSDGKLWHGRDGAVEGAPARPVGGRKCQGGDCAALDRRGRRKCDKSSSCEGRIEITDRLQFAVMFCSS